MSKDYYKTKSSVDEYIEMAKDVDSIQIIDKLKRYLPSDSSLLELGTGPGTDWKILNKHYQITGSDFSNVFIKAVFTILFDNSLNGV